MKKLKIGTPEYEAAREKRRQWSRDYYARKSAKRTALGKLAKAARDGAFAAPPEVARAVERAPSPEGGPLLPLPMPPVPGSPVSDTLLQKIDANLQDVETAIRRTRFEIAVYMEYRRTR